jgi:hypothetical protein
MKQKQKKCMSEFHFIHPFYYPTISLSICLPLILSTPRLRLLCGAGGYPLNVLQPTEAYSTNPALVPPSTPEALHIRRRERPLLARRETMGEKSPIKFILQLRLLR